FFLVKENQIDRKKHADRVHASGRDDPKPAAKLGPAFGLSQQANKAAEIAVRNRRLGGHKSLPSLVVHVHVSAVIAVTATARHFISVPIASSHRQGLHSHYHCLVNRLTLAPPDDDAKHHESENSRDDSD